MTQPNMEDLFGGGGKALKFEKVGDTFGGKISHTKITQQTKFPSGDLMFNQKTGEPLWQVLVTIQTNLRDPAEATDNGERTLYVKGNMLFETGKALKKHGLKAPEVGGTIVVKLNELEDTGKGNPLKKYVVAYQPATTDPAVEQAFSGVTQQAPPVQQPQYQQPNAGHDHGAGQYQQPQAQPQYVTQAQQPPPAQYAPQPQAQPQQEYVQQPVAQAPPVQQASNGGLSEAEAALLAQLG